METQKPKFSDLAKMEKGEIPTTPEGQQAIDNFKAKLGGLPKFGQIASSQLHFSKVLQGLTIHNNLGAISSLNIIAHPLGIKSQFSTISSVLGQERLIIEQIAAQIKASQEAMRSVIASIRVDTFSIHIGTSRVNEVFKQIQDNPELRERFKLLGEKERLLYAVINDWKGHLVARIDQMPYEYFADQFEYACYALIDDARTNEELSAIRDRNFIDVLLDVAAEINIKAKKDFELRVQKQASQLEAPKALLLEAPKERSLKPESTLSARQKALLVIFREGAYSRSGEGNIYNHYRQLRRPSNRTGFAEESWNAARRLVEDYEVVIEYLEGSQKKRAEDELVIIINNRL